MRYKTILKFSDDGLRAAHEVSNGIACYQIYPKESTKQFPRGQMLCIGFLLEWNTVTKFINGKTVYLFRYPISQLQYISLISILEPKKCKGSNVFALEKYNFMIRVDKGSHFMRKFPFKKPKR